MYIYLIYKHNICVARLAYSAHWQFVITTFDTIYGTYIYAYILIYMRAYVSCVMKRMNDDDFHMKFVMEQVSVSWASKIQQI